MSYSVTVKKIDGKSKVYTANDKMRVSELIAEIAKFEGITPQEVQLIYSGISINEKAEDSKKTLEELGIQAGSSFFLAFRLRG